ncbi:MAG: hypothetical protein UZ18_ATM001001621 [Armatimonadetes bacterium OLB18]|nr:MAG: hypothetical protein UZ18_ATM001001621 [Armatimonadetes bacterium OLB18]
MKRHRWWWALSVSAIAGAMIWALSPLLVGHSEPWDADGYFYVLALIIAGLLAGLLAPRPLWAHYVGALVGQLGYELVFLRVGPLFVLGAAFLLGYSLIFVVAAGLAARLHAPTRAPSVHV